MKRLSDKEVLERNKKIIQLIGILLIVSMVGLFYVSIQMVKYKLYYDEAVKQGAEDMVTALQMTAACMSIGNVSQEEILRKTIDMFVLNETQKDNNN